MGTGSESFQSGHTLCVNSYGSPRGGGEGEHENRYLHSTSNTLGLQKHLSSAVGPPCAGSFEG